ncbi:hypothetical protein SAMN05192583_1833 [Sphingomonas gellani]|uniref:CHAD domain-containing protein n=1 Tax=Sphingomonas gellani TaxID=1166340 RepID=A0A1H8D8P6_9SPHN|nr:hypothetical protein SAMN05192583_1833 [Sphingomonas gellani]
MTARSVRTRTLYAQEQLDALFQAVETDDVVDPDVSLPVPVPVHFSEDDMRRCLDLCVQFWMQEARPAEMRHLAERLLISTDLPEQARLRYKHVRASYKHLRFALVLYGVKHRPPRLFAATVAVMGHLQDAFRNRRPHATRGYALLLRLLLSRPISMIVRREVERVRLDDAAGFLRFRRAEIGRVATWLQQPQITAHVFHAVRKVVSRQVSFYDTLHVLQPDDRLWKMSRFLSAINGLMGDMHDDLVRQAGTGHRDYARDTFALPHDIRWRLDALIAAYPTTDATPGVA